MNEIINYTNVTEIAGDEVAPHQVERSVHRYSWASEFCHEKDVLELACGSGQGAKLLKRNSISYVGLDYCSDLVEKAKVSTPELSFIQGDACNLPFEDNSKDIIIFFEAIYYIENIDQLMSECKRVLRADGKILITSTNKDLFDFHKSDYTYKYLGADEFGQLGRKYNMRAETYGFDDLSKNSLISKLVRVVKYLAEKTALIPKTMDGKKWLKKLVYGDLIKMPTQLSFSEEVLNKSSLTKLNSDSKDKKHAYLYIVMTNN